MLGADLYRLLVCREIGSKVYLPFVPAVVLIIVYRDIPVIPHSAEEDIRSAVKGPCVAVDPVVPFSYTAGVIARVFQALSDRSITARDILSAFFKVKKSFSGVYHGAARHTDSRCRSAGDMCVRKRHSAANEPVKVRSIYLIVSECMDGSVALIVGQQKKHIRSHLIFILTHFIYPLYSVSTV